MEFADMQGLLRFGHGHLQDSCFMLLTINDAVAAGAWLNSADITTASTSDTRPSTATQVAFTPAGLRALGLSTNDLNTFPDEYAVGMAGDEGRSRRLGDVDANAPENWVWGYEDAQHMHVLLLMYAKTGELTALKQKTQSELFDRAFSVLHVLPTDKLGRREPFGFVDGISQPAIDWMQDQQTDKHSRGTYSNLLAPGEIVLGYRNEYGQFTSGPVIDASDDSAANDLPWASTEPLYETSSNAPLYDLGRNGSYLVLRQLEQNVLEFHDFTRQSQNKESSSETLAALMVGRDRDGAPLVAVSEHPIPGIPASHSQNHFNYNNDPHGQQCPLSSHVRRSNPRTGDLPPGVNGIFSRIVRLLGFGRAHEYEDVIASSRFHRILRRGRTYGETPALPETQSRSESPPSGLQFICLAANIVRQFEFVQSAWCSSASFAGLHEQRDPLIAHRSPLANGSVTDAFTYASKNGPAEKHISLPQFVTVRGGGYFFMPGIRALGYLAKKAQQATSESSEPRQDSA